MTHHTLAGVVLALFFVCGCGPTTETNSASDTSPNLEPESSAIDDSASSSVAPAPLSADELASILDVQVYAFSYSGGRVSCWLEVDDGTMIPRWTTAGDEEGKILLWWKRGELTLSFFSNGRPRGGSSNGYPDDYLWWGWEGGWNATTYTKLNTPLTPDSGEEVTLLHYKAVEKKAADPENPRTVTVTLKARFPKEE